jgi:hypothetical protein
MHDHLVEFYETDDLLVESVRDFVGPNLQGGEPVVVVATSGHHTALVDSLESQGHDIPSARRNQLFFDLDAQQTLARFMVDGRPVPELFQQVIGSLVRSAGQGNSRLRIYGEMVALLWDHLSKSHPFTLFCAYPLSCMKWAPDTADFRGICSTHSSVRIRFATPPVRCEVDPPAVPADQFARLQGIGSDLSALKEVIRNANQMGRLAGNNKTFGPGSEAFTYRPAR